VELWFEVEPALEELFPPQAASENINTAVNKILKIFFIFIPPFYIYICIRRQNPAAGYC